MSVHFGHLPIGLDHPPVLIAEMSGNHDQSLERALAIVGATATAGADAVKLQTYTADSMTLDIRNEDFVLSDPDNLWSGQNLYELYQQAHTPWEWHPPIFERCHELGMVGFSSPFDEHAVDFLETLHFGGYKVPYTGSAFSSFCDCR